MLRWDGCCCEQHLPPKCKIPTTSTCARDPPAHMRCIFIGICLIARRSVGVQHPIERPRARAERNVFRVPRGAGIVYWGLGIESNSENGPFFPKRQQSGRYCNVFCGSSAVRELFVEHSSSCIPSRSHFPLLHFPSESFTHRRLDTPSQALSSSSSLFALQSAHWLLPSHLQQEARSPNTHKQG